MLPRWKLLISRAPGAAVPEPGAGWSGEPEQPCRDARSHECLTWPGFCILLSLTRLHSQRRQSTETAKTAKTTQSRVAGSSTPCGECGAARTHQGRGLHLPGGLQSFRPTEASGGRRKAPWEASTPSLLKVGSPLSSTSTTWEPSTHGTGSLHCYQIHSDSYTRPG